MINQGAIIQIKLKYLLFILRSLKQKGKLCKNKNSLTEPANRKKTRHHAHLSLCGKSRKTNDPKSRKWPKISIWAIFFDNFEVKYLLIFLKNMFHSSWRSYLVLTSGQKPKKSLELFLRKISVSDFGLI